MADRAAICGCPAAAAAAACRHPSLSCGSLHAAAASQASAMPTRRLRHRAAHGGKTTRWNTRPAPPTAHGADARQPQAGRPRLPPPVATCSLPCPGFMDVGRVALQDEEAGHAGQVQAPHGQQRRHGTGSGHRRKSGSRRHATAPAQRAARAPELPLIPLTCLSCITAHVLLACRSPPLPSSTPRLTRPAALKERCEINKQLSRAMEDACIASARVGLSVGLHPVLLA